MVATLQDTLPTFPQVLLGPAANPGSGTAALLSPQASIGLILRSCCCRIAPHPQRRGRQTAASLRLHLGLGLCTVESPRVCADPHTSAFTGTLPLSQVSQDGRHRTPPGRQEEDADAVIPQGQDREPRSHQEQGSAPAVATASCVK